MANRTKEKAPEINDLPYRIYATDNQFDTLTALIGRAICEAIEKTNPIKPCIVTRRAREEVAAKLYNLPQLCEELEHAGGLEALLISQEIQRIKAALTSISQDPYYPLIPAKFFHGATAQQAATLCACDKVTVWRNQDRLLNALALRLLGVSAWE